MDQNNGYNNYNNSYGGTNQQGNSTWNAPQMGMNLPYNGNPETFKANVDTTQTAMYMQNMGNVQNVNQAKPKNKKKIAKIVAAILIVVLIAGGAGAYLAFFTPEKRFDRHLNKGIEAMQSNDYELAYDEYNKALDIDDQSIEAMKGSLDSGLHKEDTSELSTIYKEYTDTITAMDKQIIEDNADDIADIYAMAPDIYTDDRDSCMSTLEAGIELLGESDTLSDLLIGCYIEDANAKLSDELYDEALELYDSAAEIDSENTDVVSGRKTCIDKLLGDMITAEDFDAAEDMISEYKDKVDNVNFTEYSQKIENQRALVEAGHDLLADVYECMTAGNYGDMINYDTSQEASTVNSLRSGNCYVYAEDGFTSDYTGTATGLYGLEGGGYYFYCGEYKDGERSGHGVYYLLTDVDNNTYDVYDGQWGNNKPNGQGTITTYNEPSDGEIITTAISGSYTDGYEDGDFTLTLTSDAGYTVTGSWTATMGKANDIRENYPDLDWSSISDSRIVYALAMSDDESVKWYFSIGEAGYLKLSPF